VESTLPTDPAGAKGCEQCAQLRAIIVELEKTVARLEARVAELEAELRRGKRQAARFSKGKGKGKPKKAGRRRGEGRFERRAKPEVRPTDRVEEIAVHLDDTRCARNRGRLARPGAREPSRGMSLDRGR